MILGAFLKINASHPSGAKSWTYIDIALVHIWTLVRASAIFSCNKQIRDWQQHRDRTWNLCTALKILQKSNYVFGIHENDTKYSSPITSSVLKKKKKKKERRKKKSEKIERRTYFLIISIHKYHNFRISLFQRDFTMIIESVRCD